MTAASFHLPAVSANLSRPWRRSLATFVALHGVAHLVGTATAFQNAADGETAEYLGGLWDISSPAVLRTVGIAWAVMAVAFVLAAALIWRGHSRWATVLGYTTGASLILTILGLIPAVVGVVVNLALFGFVQLVVPHPVH